MYQNPNHNYSHCKVKTTQKVRELVLQFLPTLGTTRLSSQTYW